MPGQSAVYVVAKAPRAGVSKTRLCPPLTPAAAAHLAAAFLLDSVHIVRQAGLDARIICRDDGERRDLARLVGDQATVAVQSGHGLGAALESAFRLGFASGCTAVGVLGSDNPTLPPAALTEAYAALAAGSDVSIGPSEDGGYYLLAARALYPDLFRNMVWSTSEVVADHVAAVRGGQPARPSRCRRGTTWTRPRTSNRLRADLAGSESPAPPPPALRSLRCSVGSRWSVATGGSPYGPPRRRMTADSRVRGNDGLKDSPSPSSGVVLGGRGVRRRQPAGTSRVSAARLARTSAASIQSGSRRSWSHSCT